MSSSAPSAEKALLHLEVLSPEEVLFEGDVAWIQVPLHDGLLGIWPGHAPLVGALAAGQVRFELDGLEQSLEVTSGVLRVGVERCAILVAQTSPAAESWAGTSGPSERDALGDDMVATLHEALPEEIIETLERGEDAPSPRAEEV